MALPTRARPSSPHSQSLPSGSLHKPLILRHQRADILKTTITENKPKWSHGSQPCVIWNYETVWPMKLATETMDHAMQGQPRWTLHGGEFWQNVVPWGREWQTTSAFLPWGPCERYIKWWIREEFLEGKRKVSSQSTVLRHPMCILSFISPMSSMNERSTVQSLSHVWLLTTPWITACQASLSITNTQSLPKPMSIELVMLSSHLILCRPLLLLPPILPSIRVFSNDLTSLHEVAKVLAFQLQHQSFHEHPGLMSFRMYWLDLLAVQGTLKSLLQHHSSKASILWHSAFLTTNLTSIYDYWKNHSLD